MKGVLLHVCCGPCATWPLAVLKGEGLAVTLLFANPNLDPVEEHERRREAARRLAASEGLELAADPPGSPAFARVLTGEGPERCRSCYRARLDRAAAEAAHRGLGRFTTSLLVSPHQRHELVAGAGEAAARRHGVTFLYRDFRPGWAEAIRRGKELGLYRQRYCGCARSRREREENR